MPRPRTRACGPAWCRAGASASDEGSKVKQKRERDRAGASRGLKKTKKMALALAHYEKNKAPFCFERKELSSLSTLFFNRARTGSLRARRSKRLPARYVKRAESPDTDSKATRATTMTERESSHLFGNTVRRSRDNPSLRPTSARHSSLAAIQRPRNPLENGTSARENQKHARFLVE